MEEPKNILTHITTEKIEVPDEKYFTSLAGKIIITSKTETKIIPLYRKPIFKWAMAAAVILPLVFFFLMQNNNERSNEDEVLFGLNNITTAEIHSYIMDNQEEFTMIEVAEMTSKETLANFTINSEMIKPITSDFFDNLSLDDIQQYFESNEINIEELEQEELFI